MSNQQRISIDTGEIRLLVENTGGEIVFNPSDIGFAERFYALLPRLEAKKDEYAAFGEQFGKAELDADGIPVGIEDGMAKMREVIQFLRDEIDEIFGEGTSQAAFGDAMTLDMFDSFFSAVTPFVRKVRDQKVKKYTSPRPRRKRPSK